MKANTFLPVACLVALSGCAPYQLVPVTPVAKMSPLPHHEINIVVEAEAPTENAAIEQEPTFRDLSPSAWTVQIAALKNLEDMATVVSENRLDDVIRIPTRDSELGDLHTVVVGVYTSLQDAEKVAQKLPEKVAGDDPWIRSVASVQAVMR